ncbi:hypothetical protein [Nocardia sp. NPDC046763]|uniref:hypothetical protein n=1 Tax=Nocardia sp. NPDC046763 TaxID=3155256 RepID=UPI0033E4C64C
MEDGTAQIVAAFLKVRLRLGFPPIGFVVSEPTMRRSSNRLPISSTVLRKRGAAEQLNELGYH